MNKHNTPFKLSALIATGLFFSISHVHAALPLKLNHQAASSLPAMMLASHQTIDIKETSRSLDANQTLHVRLQETYAGVPIWGADAVLHVAKGKSLLKSPLQSLLTAAEAHPMDGTFYQNLAADLAAPGVILDQAQAAKAMQQVLGFHWRHAGGVKPFSHQQSQPVIYIDASHRAHWAFLINFDVPSVNGDNLPAKPFYLVDAVTFDIYASWDDIQTINSSDEDKESTQAGGNGGNKKSGEMIYDGSSSHLPALSMLRDLKTHTCYLQNADVTVKHFKNNQIVTFSCEAPHPDHNQLYWDGEFDAVNGGYSPSNDALFGGIMIKQMYQSWYKLPVLIDNGKPMVLNMVVHEPIDNAYWDGKKMTFGDGLVSFYPLTSLGVAAHEISHGFTQQHSGLKYYGESGGMNESFSDMAAQAAEYFAYGKNSWQIGPEVFKREDTALRYMDQPSKDCHGKKPGNWCSIDSVDQYTPRLDVHFSSGIYNRVFYLIGTSEHWNTKKAFDVMVQANMNYWTSQVDFASGACGVLKAAKDYGYDTQAVVNAFAAVGIATKDC